MASKNTKSRPTRDPESLILWIRLPEPKEDSLPQMPKEFELVSKDHDSFLFAGANKRLIRVALVSDLDAIFPVLYQRKPDLVCLDTGKKKVIEIAEAVAGLKKNIRSLSDNWGPEFFLPLSRVVLASTFAGGSPSRAGMLSFELARWKLGGVVHGSTEEHATWEQLVATLGYAAGPSCRSPRNQEFGMALSGGGLDGLLFQLGTLLAIEKAVKGRKFADAKVISGISSGSIVGSIIASGADATELVKAFAGKSDVYPTFTASMIYDFAATRMISRFVKEQLDIRTLLPDQWTKRITRSIPTGIFKGDALEGYFREILETTSCKDSFEALSTELMIGTTDQDSFNHVIFGTGDYKDAPISKAMRASASLPPVFTPVEIDGRYYIDGQVTSSCNLEAVFQRGVGLCFILDPLKPYATLRPGSNKEAGGFHTTLQVIKAMVSTRFEDTIRHITERYPEVDFLVFQPDSKCSELMLGSPMRFKIQIPLIQAAYESTIDRLKKRYRVYNSVLHKHGFHLIDESSLEPLKEQFPV
jgi:predicted acylesterase/phospholipase RssA